MSDPAIRELGRRELPAGATEETLRASPAFEQLEAQLARLSSLEAGGQADWGLVAGAAAGVLGQARDLRAACALCLALLQRHGPDGLADGVAVLKDLVEREWAALLPPVGRLRARRNLLAWCVERLEEALPGAPEEVWPEARITAVLGDLDALDDLLAARMEDPPPLFRVRALLADRLRADAGPPEPAAEPEPEPDPEPEPEVEPQAPEPAAAEVAAAPVPAPAVTEFQAALAAAGARIEFGNWAGALDLLAEGERRAPSQRERLLWRTELCRVLARSGRPALLNARARQLLEQLDAYRVLEWEPELALAALETLATGLRMAGERDPGLWAEVFTRLARVDPGRALGFS